MFLPDRYIKGECPKCHAKDQYGDSCEVCSAVYAPTELIEPYSALTGATPVLKSSDHFFFKLSDPRCVEFLQQWTTGSNAAGGKHLQPEMLAKTREWLGADDGEAKLGDWDISRDAPYFGIEIPGAPGKYFYVWLDAPVGYLASLKSYCALKGLDFDALLDPAGSTEQVHFIGKDIVYFHALFWPAMLKFSGRKVPDALNVHGFITVSGEKMSKSRGTGISPLRYLELGMDAEWMRYYMAAKLNSHVEDMDFNPDDFIARVNSDLIGKYVNIASRAASFISKRFDGVLGYSGDTAALAAEYAEQAESIRAAFEAREYNRAIREIMAYADRINQAFDTAQPWVMAKGIGDASDEQRPAARYLLAHPGWLQGPVRHAGAGAARPLRTRGPGALRRPNAVHLGGRRGAAATRGAVQAPDAARRTANAGRPVRAARRSRGGATAANRWPTPSPSTTSPASTCASRRSSTASRWKVRPSCCA